MYVLFLKISEITSVNLVMFSNFRNTPRQSPYRLAQAAQARTQGFCNKGTTLYGNILR